jgi:adenosine/AMP kinase
MDLRIKGGNAGARIFIDNERKYDGIFFFDVNLILENEAVPEVLPILQAIAQRQQEPVNEQAFGDCVRTVLAEHQAASVETEEDILAYRERMKQRKGMKG